MLKAIIRNDKVEILVCKEYDSNAWSLPGGGWDHGETEKQALARELFEEIGYQGDFKSNPVKTDVSWLESKRAWLLWIVYDIVPENYIFKVGEYCSAAEFIDPKNFKDFEHRTEKWIYEYFTNS